MSRTRIRTAVVAAVAILSLTAACDGGEQGTAERAGSEDPSADTEADPVEEAEGAPADEERPETDLMVGDSFRYPDGLKVTVTKFAELKAADFGELDTEPEADRTAFRVSWDVANGSKKSVDVEAWGWAATGGSTGREPEPISVGNGSRHMTGRLAPGRTGSFTAEYSLPKSDGSEVAFAMVRMAGAVEDPSWIGTIE